MNLLILILSIQIFSGNLRAKGLDAHVHGSVLLDIAMEKKQLLLMLKTPSSSFLGFEYKAVSEKDKKIVNRTKSEWNTHLLSYLGKEELKDCHIKKSKWKQKISGKAHSSIIAESLIQCDKPLRGRTLNISFREKYKLINNIKIQLLREDGSILIKKFSKNIFNIKL